MAGACAPLAKVLAHATYSLRSIPEETTAVQNGSTETGPLAIETRSGLAESAIFLKEAYLLVKFKIARQDGNVPYALAHVGLTHGALSLFQKAQLDLNQSNADRNNGPGQSFHVLTKASKSLDWLIDKVMITLTKSLDWLIDEVMITLTIMPISVVLMRAPLRLNAYETLKMYKWVRLM